jgi:hypothetical protein
MFGVWLHGTCHARVRVIRDSEGRARVAKLPPATGPTRIRAVAAPALQGFGDGANGAGFAGGAAIGN